jgi:5-methylcytosine-specific restriction endonuclease McrA
MKRIDYRTSTELPPNVLKWIQTATLKELWALNTVIANERRDRKIEWRAYYNQSKREYSRTPYGRAVDSIRHARGLYPTVIHNFTANELTKRFVDSKGICSLCNKNIGISKLCLDHAIPASIVDDGFVYTIDDVNLLCKGCNTIKAQIPAYI